MVKSPNVVETRSGDDIHSEVAVVKVGVVVVILDDISLQVILIKEHSVLETFDPNPIRERNLPGWTAGCSVSVIIAGVLLAALGRACHVPDCVEVLSTPVLQLVCPAVLTVQTTSTHFLPRQSHLLTVCKVLHDDGPVVEGPGDAGVPSNDL